MRYFRTSPQAYSQIQISIDAMFHEKYIKTGRCEHILPVELIPREDGYCYLAISEWMIESEEASNFLKDPKIEEINEDKFQPKSEQQA